MKTNAHRFFAALFIPVSLWSATLSGIVRSNGTGTPIIAGAKVSVFFNNSKVDSTSTNGMGQYFLTIGAGTYTVKFSATGLKSVTGMPFWDTSITAASISTIVLNASLAQATSTILGRVIYAPIVPPLAKTAATLVTKIVLQRQSVSNGSWMVLDSTFSDSIKQTFVFSNLIAATGGVSGGYYRLIATFGSSDQASPNNNLLVAVGATDTSDIMMAASAVFPPVSENKTRINFSKLGDQLVLDVELSDVPRVIEVFDLNGILQRQVSIAAGKSQAILPATFAPENGFLFTVK